MINLYVFLYHQVRVDGVLLASREVTSAAGADRYAPKPRLETLAVAEF